MIIVREQLSLTDFLWMLVLTCWHNKGLRRLPLATALLSAGLGLFCFALGQSAADSIATAVGLPIFAATSLIGIVLVGGSLVFLLFRKRVSASVTTFTHWGFESTDGLWTISKPWRELTASEEKRGFFVLHAGKQLTLIVRKQSLSGADSDALRRLLREKDLLPGQAGRE